MKLNLEALSGYLMTKDKPIFRTPAPLRTTLQQVEGERDNLFKNLLNNKLILSNPFLGLLLLLPLVQFSLARCHCPLYTIQMFPEESTLSFCSEQGGTQPPKNFSVHLSSYRVGIGPPTHSLPFG